ncbi:UvsY recombination, repair and single-stranded DNA binding protein [Aeromonas phage 65]|uniref:Single stranded DNA-binding protein n=2 Tax=Ishigurovirus osborne TaxID=260149 RepID=A0A219YBX7_9CAUD|nr:UvsY recombination, repair and single-stranded DNA binding protein [Aeromonas phage 65]ADQ53072.1 UvsY recombination, repair and single-stranded DNA binding protein [Aeromonas phage 65]APU01452.1 single stranded DNA-binding protein [Aeromonas phage 65.2]
MSHSLESLQEELDKDLIIDRTNIQSAAVSNPVIYGKWIKYKADLCRQRIGLEAERLTVTRDSLMHNTGRGDDVCMFEFSSTELKVIIPAEDEVMKCNKKVDYIDVMIKFCDGAIESVRQRGFSIRAIIDHQALMAGIK